MDSPKIDETLESLQVFPKNFAYHRDSKHLLRSTGHPLSGGIRLGNDHFHVFREEERPGLGAYVTGSIPDSPGSIHMVPYEWRPSLGRGFSGNDFGSVYDVKLPDVVPDKYEDKVFKLNSLGTHFISITRPGNPIADAFQFMVELRDLPRLPTILYGRAKYLSQIAENYLNVEFGWKPFVNDLRKMYIFSKKVDDRLKQLVRDNGLPVRRKRKTVSPTTTSTLAVCPSTLRAFGPLWSVLMANDPAWQDYYLQGPENDLLGSSVTGSASLLMEKVEKTTDWFVCTYKYYIPDIGSLRWTDRAKSLLFGGELTPRTAYEVMPWSWLIDWFTNIGDIVSNYSANAVDNEVLTDCFVMRHEESLIRITADVAWDSYDNHVSGVHINSGKDNLVYLCERENKYRRAASPYAFGGDWDDWSSFTSRQLAILAALGITQGPSRVKGIVR